MIIQYQYVEPDYIVTIYVDDSNEWTIEHLTLNMVKPALCSVIPESKNRWLISMRSDELLCLSNTAAIGFVSRTAAILRARAGNLEVIRATGSYQHEGSPVEMSTIKPMRIRKAKLVSPAGSRPKKPKEIKEEFDD